MIAGVYGDERDAIVSFDPRTKLLVFIVASSVSLVPFTYAAHASLAALICAMIFLNGKRGLALKIGAAYAAIVYLRSFVIASTAAAPAMVGFAMLVISLALFFFPIFAAFLLLALTTRMSRLVSALQRMRLPMVAIIPLAVLLRFIPAVRGEWAGVRKAMAFRGISLSFGAILRHPARSIEFILIPLLFSTISVIEELAAASLARGLDGERARTSLDEARLALPDWTAVALAIALFVVAQAGRTVLS